MKPQRIAIIHDKQQYGEGLARSVQDGLKAANANVVFFDGITAGEKDFSALIARLKKENIDFVYYGGYYPEMGQMLRQARSVGLKLSLWGRKVWVTHHCRILPVMLPKACWSLCQNAMTRIRQTRASLMR
ncbi:Leucine-specific transport system [Escherichia coli]|uniref:Leucine-specific transport system n=1 Tax=Escherichia coli TaxID=562 RepID=A0A376TXQ4_ECOLX|nr:Leucine-specific transport system [Escherichia coli]